MHLVQPLVDAPLELAVSLHSSGHEITAEEHRIDLLSQRGHVRPGRSPNALDRAKRLRARADAQQSTD